MILHFLFVPTTNLDAPSIFPTVADNPIRVISLVELIASLSRLSDNWEPRSLANNS